MSMSPPTIYNLRPDLQQKLWGGSRLAKLKGSDIQKLGESWEVSRLKEGQSLLENGKGLREVASEEQIPYLIKFIDTSDILSVQVHPDTEYLRQFGDQKGKMECWLVLEAGPSAEVLLGFNEGVDLNSFKQDSLDKKDLSPYLKKFNPRPFDFFFVPPGTVHAIGKDIFLLEVQQSSSVTYRVWDWNRLDDQGNERELHLDKAFDVIKLETSQAFISASEILETKSDILVTDDFSFRLLRGPNQLDLKKGHRFKSLINLSAKKIDFLLNDRPFSLEGYSSLTGEWNKFESDNEELCLALVE